MAACMDGTIAQSRPLLALGLRLGAAAALATVAMLVKLAGERGAALAEIIFWRQFVTALIVTAGLTLAGRLALVRTRRFGAHARRSLYGIVGMCFVYGAVLLLPLAEATTISFTTPIFAVLLAVLLYRERVGKYRAAAVAIGFVGVAIVMQPGGGTVSPIGAAVGLIAAFMVALISHQIQDLNVTESPFAIIFWFAVLTTPLAALTLPFVFVPHDVGTWLVLVAGGVAGAVAQLLLTASLRFGAAATVIVMDYTSLLWATLYGFVVFDRLPPASLWLGAPLIVAAGITIVLRERALKRAAELAEQSGV